MPPFTCSTATARGTRADNVYGMTCRPLRAHLSRAVPVPAISQSQCRSAILMCSIVPLAYGLMICTGPGKSRRSLDQRFPTTSRGSAAALRRSGPRCPRSSLSTAQLGSSITCRTQHRRRGTVSCEDRPSGDGRSSRRLPTAIAEPFAIRCSAYGFRPSRLPQRAMRCDALTGTGTRSPLPQALQAAW